MAIFETINIVRHIKNDVYINNPNDAARTAATGNVKGKCYNKDDGDENTTYENDRLGCINQNDEGKFVQDFVFNSELTSRTINLDLINSFSIGKYTYNDPNGTFESGDDNSAETHLQVGTENYQINTSFDTFRAKMAKLY